MLVLDYLVVTLCLISAACLGSIGLVILLDIPYNTWQQKAFGTALFAIATALVFAAIHYG